MGACILLTTNHLVLANRQCSSMQTGEICAQNDVLIKAVVFNRA
jgi:hypothetical protein